MFVYSVKASALRFVAVFIVCIAAMALFLAFVPTYSSETPVNSVTDDAEDESKYLAAYIEELGWSVSDMPEKSEYTIPAVFDAETQAYNEIQKKQGFDLTEYSGKTATKYTYEITNYNEHDGTVYLNLLTFSSKVIGGDICSAEDGGFILGLNGR